MGRSGALAVGRASEEERDNQEEGDKQRRRAKSKRRDKPRRKEGDDMGEELGGKTDGGCKISASLKIKVTSARARSARAVKKYRGSSVCSACSVSCTEGVGCGGLWLRASGGQVWGSGRRAR